MTHRLNLFLLCLAVAVALPYYWLVLYNPPRNLAPEPVHMADLRRLADGLPGPRPASVTVTLVGWDRTPGTLLAAGGGLKRRMYSVVSFRLDVPGQGPIVIDTGITAQLARKGGVEGFRPRGQQQLYADMRAASHIVSTDESHETLAGLAALAQAPNSAMALTRARLNPAQLPAATRAAGLPWPDRLTLGAAVRPGPPQVIAPGVVVIPTAAPTPGSQMVYAHLADGREYLFAGPVAPYPVNFLDLRTRSNLLDLLEGHQDRVGAMRWLITLRQWQKEAPRLYVVPGHDLMALTDKDAPSGIVYRE